MAKKSPTKRSITLQIRMTPDERKTLESAAQAAGLPVGSWLRVLGLAAAKKAGAK